jgi:N-methylhydantoinase A
MLAFGGCGPVHAAFVAQRLQLPAVLVPPSAGILSAYGCAIGRLSTQVVQSHARLLSEVDSATCAEVYGRLRDEARAMLGVSSDRYIEMKFYCDLQYAGQRSTLTLPAPDALDAHAIAQLASAFHAEYRRRFGRCLEWLPVKAINWRVRASLPGPLPRAPGRVEQVVERPAQRSEARRPMYIAGQGMVEARVFARSELPTGWRAHGPAVIEEFDTTIVVPATYDARVLDDGCVLLRHMPS